MDKLIVEIIEAKKGLDTFYSARGVTVRAEGQGTRWLYNIDKRCPVRIYVQRWGGIYTCRSVVRSVLMHTRSHNNVLSQCRDKGVSSYRLP